MIASQPSNIGTVVVTGASSGIGEACALQLDALGFRVFAGIRREEDGVALRHKASDHLTPVFLDVTDTASITSAAETVASALEETKLIGLVNNAGIVISSALEFLPIADLRKQFEVNVVGQIAVTQAFLPLLRQSRGRIINIGSMGGRVATPFIGAYCASKFALEALTDSLRIELRPWGIAVSIIEPGFTATPIWEKTIAGTDDYLNNVSEHFHHLYGPAIPAMREFARVAGKTGTPPDAVARTIVHALTTPRPKTRYIVGRGTGLGFAVFQHLPDKLRDFLIVHWILKGSWA